MLMATDSTELLNDELVNVTNSLEGVSNELQVCEPSSDEESEISLSEKIILESNENRLRQRMNSLQSSIMSLKEQLRLEKELWKEDIEKIRQLQEQQQKELKCRCTHQIMSKECLKYENPSRSSSIYSLRSEENPRRFDELIRTHSIKQLLELQNYKRKLAETENMCNLELNRVKQSLEDLKNLKSIASEWGKHEKGTFMEKENHISEDAQSIQELFMCHNTDKIE